MEEALCPDCGELAQELESASMTLLAESRAGSRGGVLPWLLLAA